MTRQRRRFGGKQGASVNVAAGYGEPALTAARKAGPEGRVVATDTSRLDFPHASFDAAVSRWGIIFEPDAEAAAGRIRGFLKPGAPIAISSWGEADRVPFLSVPMSTTMERLNVPPPGTPGPLSRPTPAALGGLLEGGGFSQVANRLVVRPARPRLSLGTRPCGSCAARRAGAWACARAGS
jgi:hypothetical protein